MPQELLAEARKQAILATENANNRITARAHAETSIALSLVAIGELLLAMDEDLSGIAGRRSTPQTPGVPCSAEPAE